MIEIDGIGRTYPQEHGPPVRALDGLSLRIGRGDFVAIVGASGSGKSTLMHIIGLLDRPDEGRYRLDGADVSTMPAAQVARLRNQKIGFVFQAFHLLPKTSAIENVELPLLYSDRRRVDGVGQQALAAVGLADRAHSQPSELSGGQQQRVAIARALVNNPDLVLADEPTGNLDAASAADIMALLHALNRSGRTIVLVTHDPAIAAQCRTVVRLAAGRVENPS